MCAGVTTFAPLVRLARAGEKCLVIGVGGLGHLAVQYARAMGFHVAAVDIDTSRLQMAQRLGAELCINAAECDPAATLHTPAGLLFSTAIRSVDHAVECWCSPMATPATEALADSSTWPASWRT